MILCSKLADLVDFRVMSRTSIPLRIGCAKKAYIGKYYGLSGIMPVS